MPLVYLDGVELAENSTCLVVRFAGPLNDICPFCGGSTLEIKRISMTSTLSPLTICIWCKTCGEATDLSYRYPRPWHERLMKRLEQTPN